MVGVSGDTTSVPDEETVPMPWSIETEVASVTVQDKVEDCSVVMLLGFAVKTIPGAPGTATVISADAVTVPALLRAVRV